LSTALVGELEEEEEGVGITSDVVKVEGRVQGLGQITW